MHGDLGAWLAVGAAPNCLARRISVRPAAVSPRLRLSWPPWPVLPPPPLLTGPARRLRRHAVVRFRRRRGHHPCGTRQWCRLAAAGRGRRHGAGEALTKAGAHGVVTAPGSVPGAGYLAAIGPGLQAAGMLAAVVAVPVIFPDGRLPGPRWPACPRYRGRPGRRTVKRPANRPAERPRGPPQGGRRRLGEVPTTAPAAGPSTTGPSRAPGAWTGPARDGAGSRYRYRRSQRRLSRWCPPVARCTAWDR